ncbi:MAG TPA: glycosyltransferase family 4 protein [Mucilaginibacter sp.]|jgi:glycosyltransferase involved in cell wall biosynthesis|nr:glycosyltransferase family 4 protein [Mucilaginibacter sp.]
MKIGIISHSPLWTTGFGVTCNQLAQGLINSGHTVCCLAIGEGENVLEGHTFKIYQVDWPKAHSGLVALINDERPDVILINFDINATSYFINFCKTAGWQGKVFAHIVMDGFPVYENLLHTMRGIDGIIVPTKKSKQYLKANGIKKVYYATHGVDRNEFISLVNKKHIRSKLGIKKDLTRFFIIGVFAKNEERKQLPKILLALHHLVFKLKQKNILLYLHTQTKPAINKGWDLEFIVSHLNLNAHVIFTAKKFEQDRGIDKYSGFGSSSHDQKQLNYIERINMCDLIVNIPFSGGFELCNIEAQACGVPLITINDSGNIKEVVGESAVLIEPAMKSIWGNGAWICLINELELADKILEIKNNDVLRQSVIEKGFANSKKFSWDKLIKLTHKIITEN